jgi:4-aminobutyrate aminotransferase-like enzyme
MARRAHTAGALGRGDRLPRITVPPPGPRSRALARRIRRVEAPGIDTLYQGRPSLAWARARGANVLDLDGNRFVDLTAGFGAAAVGHAHPAVLAAVADQAARLLHGLGDVHTHTPRVALAEALCRLAPIPDARVHFATTGSDAVEVAIKSALLATGRPGVLAFAGGYHGLTLGALAATSRPAFRVPFAPHLSSHVAHLPYGAPLAHVRRDLQGGGFGCVLVEPLLGREGIVVPPPGWLQGLAEVAGECGALLAVDEIFTGCGRTGAFLAVEREGVVPDLLCVGKALGGGMPIAAVIGRREVLEHWRTDGEALHTGTFVAHPAASAAALAVLEVLGRERLPQRALHLGEHVALRLAALADRRGVVAVRGRGLLRAVELADPAATAAVARRALRDGVILLAGGPRGTVLQIAPPLVITERQLDAALDILLAAIAKGLRA